MTLALLEDHSLSPWGDNPSPAPYVGVSPWGTIYSTRIAVSPRPLPALLPRTAERRDALAADSPGGKTLTLTAVRSWAGPLTSLSLSFFICKMRTMILILHSCEEG